MDHSEVKHFPKVDHTPAELDEPSKILLRAAAVLEEDGWIQGCLSRYDGFCAVGAIYKANIDAPDSRVEVFARLSLALGGDRSGNGIAKWNDTPGRTKGEVVSKLRAVALGL